MRSMWKGSLGFGMVAIPVKLYGATDDKRTGMLCNLHSECKTRLKQPRYCPTCDRHLESMDEVIKAYEIDKDHYIPVTPEELENIRLESTHTIQVEGFIRADALSDPRWFKDAYFLSPEEVGAKAFVLFVKAMEDVGVIAISKISIRDKEQLCAVRPYNGILLLQSLHWADELRDFSELVAFASVTDKEMEMATALINAMTKDMNLSQYKDEYREALVELIEAKLEGKVIEAPKPKKQEADLADALLASLDAVEPTKTT